MAENELELNPDPTSTYGATEAYKAAWHAKFGGDADFDAPSTPNDKPTDSAPVESPAPDAVGVGDNGGKNPSNQSGGSITAPPK